MKSYTIELKNLDNEVIQTKTLEIEENDKIIIQFDENLLSTNQIEEIFEDFVRIIKHADNSIMAIPSSVDIKILKFKHNNVDKDNIKE